VREEAGFSDSKWKSGGKASKEALLAIKKRKGADWRQGSVIGGGFDGAFARSFIGAM
jgi:hypothetical protein